MKSSPIAQGTEGACAALTETDDSDKPFVRTRHEKVRALSNGPRCPKARPSPAQLFLVARVLDGSLSFCAQISCADLSKQKNREKKNKTHHSRLSLCISHRGWPRHAVARLSKALATLATMQKRKWAKRQKGDPNAEKKKGRCGLIPRSPPSPSRRRCPKDDPLAGHRRKHESLCRSLLCLVFFSRAHQGQRRRRDGDQRERETDARCAAVVRRARRPPGGRVRVMGRGACVGGRLRGRGLPAL